MKIPKAAEDAINRAFADGRIIENGQSLKPLPPAEGISEKEFMQAVIDLARRLGWLVYHSFDSRKSEAGFLDLFLVREVVAFAELKSDTGNLTAPQRTWIDALTNAGQWVFLWRPADWPAIERFLEDGKL